MKYLVVALALATGCNNWSRRDTLAELGFAATTAVDWAQTQGIVGQCMEENAILGDCGQNVPIVVYFPMTMLAHAAIAAVLPPHWRLAWQALATGAEVNQIWRNNANGYVVGSAPTEALGRKR